MIVTTPHIGGVNRVWSVPDGRLLKELDVAPGSFPRFSPDGQWLAVGGDPGTVYAVGTWRRTFPFSGRPEFSQDSRLLAVDTRKGMIRLMDVRSGSDLAWFEEPNQEADGWHCFTPDGTRLIYITSGKEGGIHVWDLRHPPAAQGDGPRLGRARVSARAGGGCRSAATGDRALTPA